MIGSETTTRFCSGARSAGTRRLGPEELGELEALLRGHQLRAFVAIAAVLAMPVFVAMLVWFDAPPPIGAAVCIALFVGIPAALLFGSDSIGARRLLRRALSDPRVDLFAGSIDPGAVRDATVAKWIRDGRIAPSAASIEVLSTGGLSWSVDGRRLVSVRPLRTVEVGSADRALHGSERDLSASERAELARHAVEASRIGLVPIYLIGIATFWSAVVVAQGPSAAVGWQPLVGVVLGALALWVALVRRRRSAAIRRDAARARVMVGHDGSSRIEVLPESEIPWTVDGDPSAFRTH